MKNLADYLNKGEYNYDYQTYNDLVQYACDEDSLKMCGKHPNLLGVRDSA